MLLLLLQTNIFTFWLVACLNLKRLFMSETNRTRVTGVVYSLPAITSIGATNPAVRLFKYSKQTFEILDSITFISNLTEANKKGVMTFELEYSAKDQYNMKDLSAQSWYEQVWKVMNSEDPNTGATWKKFANYYNTNQRQQCSFAQIVDMSCYKLMMCGMLNMDYGNWQKCTGI